MIIRITTNDPAKNKEVLCGFVENGIFTRTVNNRHYMVKEHGYGIQTDALMTIVRLGVANITIKTKAGTVLKSKTSDWVTKGNKKDYGNGEQMFLDIKFMREVK